MLPNMMYYTLIAKYPGYASASQKLRLIRRAFRNWWWIVLAGSLWQRYTLPQWSIEAVSRTGMRINAPLVKGIGALYGIIEVFVYRVYEMPWQLEDDPLVIDIGANVGAFSLWLAQYYPQLSVVCYEPDPDAYVYLQRNLSRNSLHSSQAYQVAVTHRTGRLQFARFAAGDVGNFVIPDDRAGDQTACEYIFVDAISFSDVTQSVQRDISLLKLDCEGSEYDIVFGSDSDTWKNIQRIILEYHPRLGYTDHMLEARLGELGFALEKRLYTLAGEGMLWLARK